MTFPDHHRYGAGDIQGLLATFRTSHADCMVTTEKDAIRMLADNDIGENFLAHYPVWYLPIVVRLTDGREHLHALIEGLLAAVR